MQKLETFNILELPAQIVSVVADTVDAAAKMSIKVEWIDKVLGEIGAKKIIILYLVKPKF